MSYARFLKIAKKIVDLYNILFTFNPRTKLIKMNFPFKQLFFLAIFTSFIIGCNNKIDNSGNSNERPTEVKDILRGSWSIDTIGFEENGEVKELDQEPYQVNFDMDKGIATYANDGELKEAPISLDDNDVMKIIIDDSTEMKFKVNVVSDNVIRLVEVGAIEDANTFKLIKNNKE